MSIFQQGERRKLLIICGPTATGKTQLALQLGTKFNGELISADSRQIYKGLDVLTGKDIPKSFTYHKSRLAFKRRTIGYYGNGTKLWLVDQFKRHEHFNTSYFIEIVDRVLKNIWIRKKLPIVVGGTGLYLKAITSPLSFIHIPTDNTLRIYLEELPVIALQNELRTLDPARWLAMNRSDRYNPRRLIRAIEVARFVRLDSARRAHSNKSVTAKPVGDLDDMLWIGLTAPIQYIETKIQARIRERLSLGVLKEVEQYNMNKHSTSRSIPIGFEILSSYLSGEIPKEVTITKWFIAERQYAKRQLTWFKKQDHIHWYDITQPLFIDDVTSLVSSWYTGEYHEIKN